MKVGYTARYRGISKFDSVDFGRGACSTFSGICQVYVRYLIYCTSYTSYSVRHISHIDTIFGPAHSWNFIIYVCIHTFVYIHIYIYTYLHRGSLNADVHKQDNWDKRDKWDNINLARHIVESSCIYIYTHICIHLYIYIHIYIYIYIYFMCTRVYVYTYICIYVYKIFIYKYIQGPFVAVFTLFAPPPLVAAGWKKKIVAFTRCLSYLKIGDGGNSPRGR